MIKIKTICVQIVCATPVLRLFLCIVVLCIFLVLFCVILYVLFYVLHIVVLCAVLCAYCVHIVFCSLCSVSGVCPDIVVLYSCAYICVQVYDCSIVFVCAYVCAYRCVWCSVEVVFNSIRYPP